MKQQNVGFVNSLRNISFNFCLCVRRCDPFTDIVPSSTPASSWQLVLEQCADQERRGREICHVIPVKGYSRARMCQHPCEGRPVFVSPLQADLRIQCSG